MEERRRNRLLIIPVVLLLLLALVFGLSKCTSLKSENDLNVIETQDNSLSIPSYNENESHIFNFLPAENAKGDIIYELLSAKDSDYKDVAYFSLVNENDTRIMVEKATPAGTYTLTIRAYAADDKQSYKDIIYLYTIAKAENGYLVAPQAVEGLVYNGEQQDLIIPGTAINGTIMYKLDDGDWSESVPHVKEAGIYTVSYRVIGDPNHEDVDEQSLMVVIEQDNVEYKPSVSFSGGFSLSNLIDYIRHKGEEAASGKIPVSDKPATYVEYDYDGNEHDNNYHAPEGINMVGDDNGTCAGTYIAVYTPDRNYCWTDGTRTPVTVVLKINRAKLVRPTIDDSLSYNGKVQYAILENFDDEKMTIIGNKGKKAGTYYALVGIKDKINYSWDDSSIIDLILEWHIHTNGIKVPVVTKTYTYKATAVLDLPVVQFVTPCDFDEFDEKLMKLVSGYSGALAGDYQVRIALRDKDNFSWEDGSSEDKLVSWTINRRPVSDKPVDRTVAYDGKIHSNGYDKPLSVRSSGKTYGREIGEYVAYYEPYDNYCWSDGTTDKVKVILTIEEANAEIIREAKARNLTYNGSYQELVTPAKANAGRVLYRVESEGYSSAYSYEIPKGMDAGIYTVYYKAEGDEKHYPGEEKMVEVEIEKAEPKISCIPTSITIIYDGSEHKLVISGSSEHGFFEYRLKGGIYFSSIPRASEAGEYTIFTRFIGDKNHKDKEEFALTSTIMAKSGAQYLEEPQAIDSVYDGKPHQLVTAGLLDEGIGEIEFSLDKENWTKEAPSMINAGTYDVYYRIATSGNYEGSEVSKISATIAKADFIVADNDQTYVQDGTMHGKGLEVATIDQSVPSIAYSFNGSEYSEEVPMFADAYYDDEGQAIARMISYKIEAENFNTFEGTYSILINEAEKVVEEEPEETIYLSLSETEGTMEPGSVKDIGIDTNSADPILCSTSSDAISCKVDSDSKTLHLEAAKEIEDDTVTISVYIETDDDNDISATYVLTISRESVEPEGGDPEITENKEDDEKEPVGDISDEKKPSEENIDKDNDKPADVNVPEGEDHSDDKTVVPQQPEEKQPENIEDISSFVITESKAEITNVEILSQYDIYGEAISYFTSEGKLIKPKKETPAGRYTVEVKVTIEYEVDEQGNTKIVMIDTADKKINKEVDDEGPSEPAYPAYVEEKQDTGNDEEDDEINVPDMINEQPVLPQVVEDDPDDADDVLGNDDLNPLYVPNNDLNNEPDSGEPLPEENGENSEAEQ